MKYLLLIFVFSTFVCSILCRRQNSLVKLLPSALEILNIGEQYLTIEGLDHCGKKPGFTDCKFDFSEDPVDKTQFNRCVNGVSICMKCANGTIYQANGHCVFTDCSNDESKKCQNGQCVDRIDKDVNIRFCQCQNGWEGFKCEEKSWQRK